MSCLQAAKHSTSFACGLHGHCPVCQYEPAWLHRYFQGFLELLHCSERPPASPRPLQGVQTRLEGNTTQKAQRASSPQKIAFIYQGIEPLCDKCGQPQCRTQGLMGSSSTTVRCPAPHGTQCSPESCEQCAKGSETLRGS